MAREAAPSEASNADMGNLIVKARVKGSDKEVHVIGGKVFIKSGVEREANMDNSDEMVVIVDADGNKERVSPSELYGIELSRMEEAASAQVIEQAPSTQVTEVAEESTERPMEIAPGVAVRVGGVAGVATSFPEDGKVIVETEDGKILPYDESEVEVVGETTGTTETTETTMSDGTNESDGTNDTKESQSTASPLGAIPVDAKGKKLYEQAPIESTINAIYNNPDLDETEADALVAAKIAGATKRIAQLEKKKPKMGEDEDAYIAERAKWREQLEAEQASLAYWQGVQEARAKESTTSPLQGTPLVLQSETRGELGSTPSSLTPQSNGQPPYQSRGAITPPIAAQPGGELDANGEMGEIGEIYAEAEGDDVSERDSKVDKDTNVAEEGSVTEETVEEETPIVEEQTQEETGELTTSPLQDSSQSQTSGGLSEDLTEVVGETDKLLAERKRAMEAWLQAEEGADKDAKWGDYSQAIDALESYAMGLSDEQLAALQSHYGKGEVREIDDEISRRDEIKVKNAQYDELLSKQYPIERKERKGTGKLEDALSKDATRPVMTGVYHDEDGYAVATDAKVLVADKREYNGRKKGKIIGKDGKEIPGNYPKWKLALPVETEALPIDLQDLSGLIGGVKAKLKENGIKPKDYGKAVVMIKTGSGTIVYYPVDYLETWLNGAMRLGATGSDVGVSERNGFIVAKTKNGVAMLASKGGLAYNDTGIVYEVNPSSSTPQSQGDSSPKGRGALEKQVGGGVMENATEAQRLATEAVITSLEASGIEVVEVSDAMAEAVMGMGGVELMAVEEAKRRADAIEGLTPINVTSNNKTKEELSEDYKNLPSVEKEGRVIEFYNSAFKKNYKEGGLFAQVVPQLDEILKQSVLAYSEKDNRGGVVRPDGTIHKTHPNVDAFDNYVGKVEIEGKEYYVRTTVKRQEGESGTHSFFVTEVAVYEKSANGLSEPNFPSGESDHQRIVDTKLQQFFDYANGKLQNPEFQIVYHGSGAKFDAFDHSHMGEGEGAQAYGWGTYVTEVKGIGIEYANAMVEYNPDGDAERINVIKREIKYSPIGYYVENLQKAKGLIGALKEEFEGTEDWESVRGQIEYLEDLVEEWEGIENKKYYRQLYTVEIPEDNGSNYLYHDKVMANNVIADVKRRLYDILSQGQYKGAERELREELDEVFVSGLEGDVLYNNVSAYLGGDKQASQFFNEMGFVGIKYPAQYTTGGRADGKSNYVIFNEADAKITSRVEFLKTPQGVVYGWTDGKKVYLTKEGMNPETPIHEYTHLWARAMMQGNAEGWQSVKDLLRGTPVWNEVMSDANYADIHGDEDAVASECLARLSGKENAKRMEAEARKMIDEAKGVFAKADAVTLVERMKKALQEFWNWVGKNLFDIKSFGSIEEVTDRVLYDLIHNSQFIMHNSELPGIEKQIIGERGAVMVDNQGNPIDEDGKLIVEQVSSIDEITDADFDSPTRSIQLPSIPPKVDEAIGANGKPIVIKKNVFEKNKKSHKDLTPKDSRAILINTLYSPDLYGQNQKITRPYNWILIHLADTNTAVLVEVNENKDNVEIVNWHYINDDAIERKKKQAIREGGLILTLESAAADTSNFLPSADKVNNNNSEKQENNESNGSDGSTNAERDSDEGILFRDGDVTTSPLASGGESGTTAEASTVGYSDAEVSMANDPIAKVMGKSQRSKKQQAKFAERERKYMRNRVAELAEKMHLDNVEVVDNSQLTPSPQGGTPPKQGSGGELNASNGGVMSARKARAKGWFDTRTGRIVINISNHLSVADVERTLLHEAVAHYGLRQLFGKQFDTFLDNVYLHADAEVRAQIVELAKKHGWEFIDDTILAALGGKITRDLPPSLAQKVRTATEEYLAGLAEDTNFEALEHNWSWWQKIKQFFMDMLESIGWDYKGPELSDNELRYLLWRSYENMVNPGRHRSILGKAEDVAKQYALGVGNYSADAESMSQVAEEGEKAEPQPIGNGAFGAIYTQFRGKAKEAIAFLMRKQSGEAIGALSHPEIGEIDLVWGKEGTSHSDGYGLAKLVKYHPEVLDNLQEILSGMNVVKRSPNRVQLESNTHKASVRLTWDNQRKTWLLTAFEKKETPETTISSTGVDNSPKGLLDDTAPQQSSSVSADKVNNNNSEKQENNESNGSDGSTNAERGEAKLTIGGIDLGKVKATSNRRKMIATTRSGHNQIFKSVHKYAIEKFGAENVEYEKAKSGSIYMTVDLPNGHYVEIRFASHTPSGYSAGEIETNAETKGIGWSAINGSVGAKVDISFNTMTSDDLQAFLDLMNEYAENGFPQEVVEELQSYRAKPNEVSEALGISVDTLAEGGELYSDGAIQTYAKQFENVGEIELLDSESALIDYFKREHNLEEAEVREELEGLEYTPAAYDSKTDKILIFAWKNQNSYLNLIHEHCHKAIHKLGGNGKINQLAQELAAIDPKLWNVIAMGYDSSQQAGEMVAYIVQQASTADAIDDIKRLLTPVAQTQLNEILDYIGYGRQKNIKDTIKRFNTTDGGSDIDLLQTRIRNVIRRGNEKIGRNDISKGEG